MTEAIIIMPVLLVILYGMFYLWRISIGVTQANITVRTEMILHSLALNSDQSVNTKGWDETLGFSDNADFYRDQGLFTTVDSVNIESQSDRLSLKGDSTYTDKMPSLAMRNVLVDAAVVVVKTTVSGSSLLSGSSTPQAMSTSGICAVNSWALSREQFFGAVDSWLKYQGPAIQWSDNNTSNMRKNINPLKEMPDEPVK
jgi:hypothetical protein